MFPVTFCGNWKSPELMQLELRNALCRAAAVLPYIPITAPIIPGWKAVLCHICLEMVETSIVVVDRLNIESSSQSFKYLTHPANSPKPLLLLSLHRYFSPNQKHYFFFLFPLLILASSTLNNLLLPVLQYISDPSYENLVSSQLFHHCS